VGRLPDEAQAQDLRRLFEQYGIVTECDILNRYGFVHMKTEEMALRAIKELNNAEFMGVQISVEVLGFSVYCLSLNIVMSKLVIRLGQFWV
jgi:RNA recognition motif-containing protein